MMHRKKPNLELAQAMIDGQPEMTVFKPHPKRKGCIQKFHPKLTIDVEGKRLIDYGRSHGTFKPCKDDEKPDVNVYSYEDQKILGYIKC